MRRPWARSNETVVTQVVGAEITAIARRRERRQRRRDLFLRPAGGARMSCIVFSRSVARPFACPDVFPTRSIVEFDDECARVSDSCLKTSGVASVCSGKAFEVK